MSMRLAFSVALVTLATACTPAPAGVALTPLAVAPSARPLAPAVAPLAVGISPAVALPSVPPSGTKPRVYQPKPAGPARGAVARPNGTPGAAAGTGAPAATGSAPGVIPAGLPGATPAAPARGADALPSIQPANLYSGAWLLRLTSDTTPATVLAALPGFKGRGELTLGATLLLRVDPPTDLDPTTIRARLGALPGLASAHPEARRHRQDFDFTKPDPFYLFQWAHRADRGATIAAWDRVPAADQRKIVVAVLDTGLDITHPEFKDRIVEPRNFTDVSTPIDVRDLDGHGTHVAGIVAAAGDNDAGVAGVAWGVRIKPVKVLSDDGGGDEFDILAGFLHAVRWRPAPDDGSRVRVINMSLGSPTGAVMAIWADAVAEARAAGVVVVAASGNAGAENVDAPANTPGVLAVGSTNDYLAWEDVSPFSNHGDRLDLVAPGEDIISTAPILGSPIGEAYAYLSGTSMASPYVAGVAALVVARYDKDNFRMDGTFSEAVHRRLLRACDDLGVPGRDPWFGEGRLNAKRAVTPPNIDDVP